MPSATRKDDKCTGHDSCAPIELLTASGSVYVNGRGIGRKTDIYNTHGCDFHSPHRDVIVGGSSTVFANGLAAARIGDDVKIGGKVMEGSPNVIVGG